MKDEGNKGLAILCSSLLIVFQSFLLDLSDLMIKE